MSAVCRAPGPELPHAARAGQVGESERAEVGTGQRPDVEREVGRVRGRGDSRRSVGTDRELPPAGVRIDRVVADLQDETAVAGVGPRRERLRQVQDAQPQGVGHAQPEAARFQHPRQHRMRVWPAPAQELRGQVTLEQPLPESLLRVGIQGRDLHDERLALGSLRAPLPAGAVDRVAARLARDLQDDPVRRSAAAAHPLGVTQDEVPPADLAALDGRRHDRPDRLVDRREEAHRLIDIDHPDPHVVRRRER